MSTDRQELIARLREREQDLRAACEYVGGGVKGVIFAEVAENARDAADALEQAETELASFREREQRIRRLLKRPLDIPNGSTDYKRGFGAALFKVEAALLAPSPSDPKGLSDGRGGA